MHKTFRRTGRTTTYANVLQQTVNDELTSISVCITKTCLYNFDPLKPHFYIVKLGLTGVYIIFLISAQNIDCEYSLEPPRRGGSNEYPQSVLSRNMKYIRVFYLKIFRFLEAKFSIYLNKRVFVMQACANECQRMPKYSRSLNTLGQFVVCVKPPIIPTQQAYNYFAQLIGRQQLENWINTSKNPMSRNPVSIFFTQISKMTY